MTKQNQSVKGNQNQTIKGDVVKMAEFKMIKGVNYTAAGAENLVAQFVGAVVSGENKHVFRYGHSLMGGQAMYLVFDNKAPQRVKPEELMARLKKAGVKDVSRVSAAVKALQFIKKDAFVVAKCQCGGDITAANVDFWQRKATKDKHVNEFAPLCYKCQGVGPKKDSKKSSDKAPVQEQTKAPVIPASAREAAEEMITIPKSKWDAVVAKGKALKEELEAAERQIAKLQYVSTDAEPGLVELTAMWREAVKAQNAKLNLTTEEAATEAERSEAVETVSLNTELESKPVRKCSVCGSTEHDKRFHNKPLPKEEVSEEVSADVNSAEFDIMEYAVETDLHAPEHDVSEEAAIQHNVEAERSEAIISEHNVEAKTDACSACGEDYFLIDGKCQICEASVKEHNVDETLVDSQATVELEEAVTCTTCGKQVEYIDSTGECGDCFFGLTDKEEVIVSEHYVDADKIADAVKSAASDTAAERSEAVYSCIKCWEPRADIDPVSGVCPTCVKK